MINDEDLKDLGVVKTEDGVFLPKNFCLVSLLNWYNDPEKPLSDEIYNALADFLFELELDLGICDREKEEYRQLRKTKNR